MVIERIEKVAQQVEFVYRRPRKRNKKNWHVNSKKSKYQQVTRCVASIKRQISNASTKKKKLCVCLEVIRERKWGKHLI